MYLSRIPLDVNNRDTMRALSSLNMFHQGLEDCFSGGRTRNLWRIDSINNKLYLLLLSAVKPNLSSFCRKYSTSENAWETKDYTILLDNLKNETFWRFRITANPTTKKSHKKSATSGQVLAHITIEHQKEWLIKHSDKNGFYVSADDFDVVSNKWINFTKRDKNRVILFSATYEGMLKITDLAAFRNCLANGIGRGKAYGMGLMTVIRIRES